MDASYILLKDIYGKKLVIALIYIPPAQPVLNDQNNYEQIREVTSSHETVIFGYFNLPVKKVGETTINLS